MAVMVRVWVRLRLSVRVTPMVSVRVRVRVRVRVTLTLTGTRALSSSRRPPFCMYLDEVAPHGDLPTSPYTSPPYLRYLSAP